MKSLIVKKKSFKIRINPENHFHIHAILLFMCCNWMFENQTESRNYFKHPALLQTDIQTGLNDTAL